MQQHDVANGDTAVAALLGGHGDMVEPVVEDGEDVFGDGVEVGIEFVTPELVRFAADDGVDEDVFELLLLLLC